MKRYIGIMGISMALMMQLSCKSSKVERAAQEKKQPQVATTERTSSETISDTSPKKSEENANSTNIVEGANGSTGANVNVNSASLKAPTNSEEDLSKMYEELKMTTDQINQLERAMDNFISKQRNSPNGKMMGTVASERQRQLKQILSDEQYAAYEKWKSRN
ncbi:hypothetical protein [Arenibacter amylolyticus]|uniref:hypothetical protein n=1 Tax=Arenibacter amylolyticus TaxID=1406873 RepID=UPI000A39EC42|nr:hypothetical protein [Arenibacter amylolyticus]